MAEKKSIAYHEAASAFGPERAEVDAPRGSTPLEPYHISTADGSVYRDNQAEHRYELVVSGEHARKEAAAPAEDQGKGGK